MANEYFERMMQQHLPPMGAVEASVEGVKEAVKAFAPGLQPRKMASEIWAELKEMGSHGAHEMAAALFHGNAFVMYPRAGEVQEDPQKDVQQQDHQREPERGGREM